MVDVILFGGTSEGRLLCEHCAERGVSVLYCTATRDGAEQVSGVQTNAKRLVSGEMLALLEREAPRLVIDATHPYAAEVTRNVTAACAAAQAEYIRVTRKKADFPDLLALDKGELPDYLRQTSGNIFAAVGVGAAELLSPLRERVWLRILPNPDNLRRCLELGYGAKRMICMYPPFSQEMNTAMLKAANAAVLVTKDSGERGGFREKIAAAKGLGIQTIIIKRENESGVTLEDAKKRIDGL